MPKTTPRKTDRITVRIEPSLRAELRQYYPDLHPSEALRILAWKEIKRIKLKQIPEMQSTCLKRQPESA